MCQWLLRYCNEKKKALHYWLFTERQLSDVTFYIMKFTSVNCPQTLEM